LGDVWRQLLRALRPINSKLQALLRSGEPVALQGGDFYIRFRYEFHQNQVRASIDDLNRALSQVLGRPMQATILGENEEPPAASAASIELEPTPAPDATSEVDSASQLDPDPAPEQPSSPAAGPDASADAPTPSSLVDHPVVRRAVDKWGGEIEDIED
jgi:hypothetical protein